MRCPALKMARDAWEGWAGAVSWCSSWDGGGTSLSPYSGGYANVVAIIVANSVFVTGFLCSNTKDVMKKQPNYIFSKISTQESVWRLFAAIPG